MHHPAWILVVFGLLTTAIGALWLFGPHVPYLGKLPGDIAIEGKRFRFYFPVVSCILLSALLTGILWLIRFFSR